MRKAVFFPGTGYTCRETLFLRLKSLLEARGWTVVPLEWSSIPFTPIETVEEAGAIALGFAICSLEGEDLDGCDEVLFVSKSLGLDGCDEVLFVSKSLGCISALKYSDLMSIVARHVLLTPTPDALALISSSTDVACAVIGDTDPLMKSADLVSYGRNHGFPVMVVDGVGHSLKTGDGESTDRITGEIVSFVIDSLEACDLRQWE